METRQQSGVRGREEEAERRREEVKNVEKMI